MKYINAKELLPRELVEELQRYIQGGYLYIPANDEQRRCWGELSGCREKLRQRNREIQRLYREGCSMEALSEEYGLAHSTIRKIIYG